MGWGGMVGVCWETVRTLLHEGQTGEGLACFGNGRDEEGLTE